MNTNRKHRHPCDWVLFGALSEEGPVTSDVELRRLKYRAIWHTLWTLAAFLAVAFHLSEPSTSSLWRVAITSWLGGSLTIWTLRDWKAFTSRKYEP